MISLYAGTSSGDFLIIQVKTKQLVSIVQVAPQGVVAMASLEIDCLVVGGGNGQLVYFEVDKNECKETQRLSLQGGCITGLSFVNSLMLTATSHGLVYEVDNAHHSFQLLHQAHTDSVEFVTYPLNVSD